MAILDKNHCLCFSPEEIEGKIIPTLRSTELWALGFRGEKLIVASEAFQREFPGFSREGTELAPELFADVAEHQRFQEALALADRGLRFTPGVYRLRAADQRVCPAVLHFYRLPISDGSGFCLCALLPQTSPTANAFVAFYQDDFLRQVAEKALRGIILLNPQGSVAYINPAARAMLAAETLEGNSNLPLLHLRGDSPEFYFTLEEMTRWLHPSREFSPGVYQVVHPDGSVRALSIGINPVRRPEGQIQFAMIEDITAHQRVEQALKESEEKFRAQYKGVPLPTYTWQKVGEDFELIEYNDAAVEITQGMIKDMLGVKASALYADRPQIVQDLLRCHRDQVVFKQEMNYYFKTTGQERYLNVRYAPVLSDLVLVHTEDVTVQKQAEEALQQAEERFRTAARLATDLIFEYNMLTKEFQWFGDVDAKFGFAPGEFPRELFHTNPLVHREDRPRVLRAVEEHLRAGRPFDEVYRVRTKDGPYLDIHSRGTMVKDENGNYTKWIGINTDITERKRAEEALRESEEKFRLYFDTMSDLAFSLDREMKILSVSPAITKLTGFQPEQLIGKFMGAQKILTDEYRDKAMADFARVFSGETVLSSSYEIQAQDGQKKFVEVSSSPLFREGRVVSSICVARDVTERKLAEEKLRMLGWAVEQSVDGIAVADLSGNIRFANRAWAQMHGYEIPDLLGQPLSIFHTDEQMQKDVIPFNQEAFKKGAAYGDVGHCRKDGSVFPTWMAVTLLRDDREDPIGLLAIARDVSDKMRIEQALRESEKKYRLLAENAQDVIWTMGPDFHFTFVSPSVQAVSGYTVEELMEVDLQKLIPSQDLAWARETFSESLAIMKTMKPPPPEGQTTELQIVHKDQTLLWIEVKWSFLTKDDRVSGLQGVARDITKRKNAEAGLAAAQQLLRDSLREEVRLLRSKDYLPPETGTGDSAPYPSAAMRHAMNEAGIAAQSDGIVLLLGKSGSGKNFLAGWIHQNSSRAEGPFFDVNCASIPGSLIESELFGHEAGAFTGSRGRRRGLLELADKGTLFLDEIGDMDLALQAKLLSFLDSQKLRRVGGQTSVQVDTRIIAATNRDLESLVSEGKFREDLYYRLNVLAIRVPLLKERREDIPVLARELLKRLAQDQGMGKTPLLTPEALKILVNYQWPGNVRELRNVLERALLRAQDRTIISEIPLLDAARASQTREKSIEVQGEAEAVTNGNPFKNAVSGFSRQLVLEAIKNSRTKLEAAACLGISRHALNRLLVKYNLNDRKASIRSKK